MAGASGIHLFFRRFVTGCLLITAISSITIFAQQSAGFDQAMLLFKQSNYAGAAEVLAKVAENEPQRIETYLYLGKALLKLERFGEAAEAIRRYTAARPSDTDGAYLLAYVLFRQGRPADSLAVYRQAVRIKPPAADDLKIIGLDYGLLGDYRLSAEFLGRALALDPDNLEARYYLGRVYFTQNLFANAIEEFQTVLRRDPRHVKAQNNLGQALEGRNEIEGAMAAYRRAIEIDRDSPKPSELPLLNLGKLLLQRDEMSEALSLLQRAAAINPASAPVRFQLGKAYIRLGRTAEAEKELVRACTLDPRDRGAHYQLGRLYLRLGKTELGRRELELSERLGENKQP
jgi:tetratricopeptide (TPR) repeat protein